MLDARSIELDAFFDENLAYDEVLRQSRHILVAEALQPAQTATPVRTRNGRVSTTDGPLAEAKGELGGFFLVDARDLDAAIHEASKLPSARLRSVEVRSIWALKQPSPRTRHC